MESPILGPVEVGDGPRRLALGEPKPHALPAVLAVPANRVVATDRQPDEQWAAAKHRAEQRSKPQLPGIRSRAPPDPGAARSALRPFSYTERGSKPA